MFEALHGLERGVIGLLGNAGDGPLAALTLFVGGFGFGALHSLLPGHGKTVLAAHHAIADAGPRHLALKLARAGLDGLLIGAMRIAWTVGIVLGGWSLLERTIGGGMRAPLLEALGGAVLAALGAWMVWGALRAPPPPGTRTGGRLPALAIGLVPDPVAAVVMSYAVISDARTLGLVAMLGIALGMALTLAASASAGLLTRARLETGAAGARRLDRWLRLAGGTLIVLVGALWIWRAI